ncbi:MAG: hypothetical protein R3F31_14955 [Verrucomicrobiales bacterium]
MEGIIPDGVEHHPVTFPEAEGIHRGRGRSDTTAAALVRTGEKESGFIAPADREGIHATTHILGNATGFRIGFRTRRP